MLGELEHVKSERDTITYSPAVGTCAKRGESQRGTELLFAMEHGRAGHGHLHRRLSACEKGGDRRLAMKPYGAVGLSKVERSTVTYSAAISAGETARQWRRALELLYAMGLVKLERNTITCSAATARARMAEAGSVRLRSSAQGGP